MIGSPSIAFFHRLIVAACIFFAAFSAYAEDSTSRPLVVGSEQDYPPFALGLTDDTADGFTVDLWKVIARDAGLNYTLRVLPFHQLLQDFKDGKIDILINLAQSEDRHKFADFTVPHVTVHGAIFLRTDSHGIRGEQDLTGKSIIVVQADIAHEYAVSMGWQGQLILVPTAADGLQLLAAGKHDAMFVSKLVGMQTLEKLKLPGIQALPVTSGAVQKFSFAVKRGNADLLARLNEGLALSKSSGAYDSLYQKWFSVYEAREPTLRDMLKYLLPLLAAFFIYAGYSYFRQRKALQQLAESHHMLQTIIETMPLRIFWKDRNSRYMGCNTLFANDAGRNDPGEVIGHMDDEFAWREQAGLYQRDDRAVIDSKKAKLAYVEPQSTPDGGQIWLRTSKVPLFNLHQQVFGVLGIYDDITHVKVTEQALRDSEAQFKSLFDNMTNGFALHEVVRDDKGKVVDYRFLAINPAFERITGLDRKWALGKNVKAILPAVEDHWIDTYGQVADTGTPQHLENYSEDIGRWFSVYAYRPAAEQFAVIVADITEIKGAQEQMRLASTVYEHSSESMMVTDAAGNIITINPAFTETTGYTQEEVRGKNPRILNSGHHDQAFFQAMWHAINTRGYWQGEVWDKRKNGEIYPKWLTINTAFNADGTPYRRVALFSDITEKKNAEKLIWQQANFDALSGLPNRRMFLDRLAQEIKRASRNEHRLALLFIDLDRFKEVNDSLGHAMGDKLLIQAAQRLQGGVRESDTVARLGGDEFTVILGDLDDKSGVDRIAQQIIKSLAAPFYLDDHILTISGSIGITIFPDDASTIEALLKSADQAMYVAKNRGRNCYSYYQTADGQIEDRGALGSITASK